ncbi:hypothetical protein NITLEN_30406 [Nitrospira lenta]|uniref:Uncharacterized protein n=1 Tax=Nitrospira lenta TaxID=1436998 RepID=A0A330L6I5_9BACT|nr:hypothetical protein NITLEN_30406 [Nitrospira lenta]
MCFNWLECAVIGGRIVAVRIHIDVEALLEG